jgi:hypothetical protein|nr:MAG TPA: hypothetical protein [Caudoviricetes sp.]
MKLTIDSICLISSIIDKIEIDDKFINEMIELGRTAKEKSKENAEKIQMQIGMKIVIKLGKKLHEVRDDLVKFVANYKEISEEEAKKVDIKDIVKELISDKDFVSFFKQKVMSE